MYIQTAATVLVLCLGSMPATAATRYTEGMYNAALRATQRESLSPRFVLITVENAQTQRRRLVCVPATMLLGAIHREHGRDYDDAGMRKANEIARSRRVFRFSKPQALRNVKPDYSPESLAEVRRQLAAKSSSELRGMVRRHPFGDWWREPRYRHAFAHVLLERGILVGIQHRTGGLQLH